MPEMSDSPSQRVHTTRRPGADLINLAGKIGGPDDWMLLDELVAAAKARGMNVTWPDIYGLYNRSRLRASGSFVIPKVLTEFIGEYIKDRNAQSILDPFVGIGSLLLPLIEAGSIPRAVGIGPDTRDIKLAQAMATRPVEWLAGEPAAVLDTLDTFDLVVSSPAWGGTATTGSIETPAGPIEVRDSEANIAVLKAAAHISHAGEAIFILPNSFFYSTHSATARDSLPKLGLFIKLSLRFPPTFSRRSRLSNRTSCSYPRGK
jgi:hypothetical protein